MNPMVKSLLEFNQAFDIPKLESPALGPDELIELRIKLLEEEVQEYAEAARSGDLVEVLDALADIGYILAGTIINHGMQHIYDDAFNEVHRSNMAKLVDGKGPAKRGWKSHETGRMAASTTCAIPSN
jgi:predicted HAD superfamily Cof-like phosphohydrolase